MSMADILKCKLCGSQEYKDHLVDGTVQELEIDSMEIDYGFLGKGKFSHKIFMSEDGYYSELVMRTRGEHIYGKMIQINNCPFCGRELD